MFSWLRSFARRGRSGRRSSVLGEAVAAMIERMEPRMLLDSCSDDGLGNLTYNASANGDQITLAVDINNNLVISNSVGPNSCSNPLSQISHVTINGLGGDDTIS